MKFLKSLQEFWVDNPWMAVWLFASVAATIAGGILMFRNHFWAWLMVGGVISLCLGVVATARDEIINGW